MDKLKSEVTAPTLSEMGEVGFWEQTPLQRWFCLAAVPSVQAGKLPCLCLYKQKNWYLAGTTLKIMAESSVECFLIH